MESGKWKPSIAQLVVAEDCSWKADIFRSLVQVRLLGIFFAFLFGFVEARVRLWLCWKERWMAHIIVEWLSTPLRDHHMSTMCGVCM